MISKTIYSDKFFHLARRKKNSNELDYALNQELQSKENSEKT